MEPKAATSTTPRAKRKTRKQKRQEEKARHHVAKIPRFRKRLSANGDSGVDFNSRGGSGSSMISSGASSARSSLPSMDTNDNNSNHSAGNGKKASTNKQGADGGLYFDYDGDYFGGKGDSGYYYGDQAVTGCTSDNNYESGASNSSWSDEVFYWKVHWKKEIERARDSILRSG